MSGESEQIGEVTGRGERWERTQSTTAGWDKERGKEIVSFEDQRGWSDQRARTSGKTVAFSTTL